VTDRRPKFGKWTWKPKDEHNHRGESGGIEYWPIIMLLNIRVEHQTLAGIKTARMAKAVLLPTA